MRGVFDGRHQGKNLLPVFLFLILWGALALGGFAQVLLGAYGLAFPLWVSISVWGGLGAFVIPFVGLRWTELAYRNTEFAFHHHRLVQQSGGRFPRVKSWPLEDIAGIRLRVDSLQERYGLGTILLTARRDASLVGSTICIPDVRDPETICTRIRGIVQARQEPLAIQAAAV